MMRILRAIASLAPEQGGPVEGLKASTALLSARGHHTEVVTFDDPASAFLSDITFPVHAMGPPKNRYGYTGRMTPWARAHAADFDVAILHGLWNYSSLGVWRGLRQTRVPYLAMTHGMLDPWFKSVQPVKRWAKQAYWLAAQGLILAGADAVLFTSEEERRLARTALWGHAYREKVVAYGAADVPDRLDQQRAAFAERVPRLGARPYLLFLGRLHPKKGCDLLVSAFAGVAAAHRDINLVIAGPDEVGLRSKLHQQAEAAGIGTRIHFPGMVQGDAKWGAYRGASGFVLPSHQENFGIAVAEAMACSIPVLMSDKVNIWREVTNSGGGLVAPDTVEGTRDLLTRFLSLSAAERQEMGRKARLGYDKSFGLEGAANALEAALVAAIEGQKR